MAVDPEAAEVKAAGGVVWRRGDDGVEIVIAHRPRYDDWSLPKGKLDKGESWEQAALREVEEEVGLKCRLGPELEPTSYEDRKGRAKVVRYWLMEPKRDAKFKPNDEVDADPLAVTRGRREPRSPTPTTPSSSARPPGASSEPRPLPRPRRLELGAARRPRRHADGRHRDRGDGRLDALRPRRQPRRRLRRRARDRRAGRVRARQRRRPARRAAGPDRLRLQHDRADDGLRGRGRAHARAGRRDRLHAPRPRRQRPPVGHPRRAQRRHGALRRAGGRDARAARERGRGRADRAHALGRGHPRLQRRRHDPGPRGDRRRRARRRRPRLRRRRPRRARTAASTSPRSAATRSRAAPTSGSARTSASSGRARSCWPSCGPTSSCPPPTPIPTAGRTARCRSRRWPASPPPPTTRAAWTGPPSAPTRTRC